MIVKLFRSTRPIAVVLDRPRIDQILEVGNTETSKTSDGGSKQLQHVLVRCRLLSARTPRADVVPGQIGSRSDCMENLTGNVIMQCMNT